MEKALFSSASSEISTVSSNDHEHYLAEIKRIRNEIAGFRPIESYAKAPEAVPATKTQKVPPKVAVKPTKARVSGSKHTAVTSTYKRNVTGAYY